MPKRKIDGLQHIVSLLFVALQEAFWAEHVDICAKDFPILQHCDVVPVDLGALWHKLAANCRRQSDLCFFFWGGGEAVLGY